MTGLFIAVLASVLAWALVGALVHWIESRRRPGRELQALGRPPAVDALIIGVGIVAVLSLALLSFADPVGSGLPWFGLALVYAGAVVEAACWVTGVHRYAFFEHGVQLGHRWIPYTQVENFETEGDEVVLWIAGKPRVLGVAGGLSVEVRIRLSLEGWT